MGNHDRDPRFVAFRLSPAGTIPENREKLAARRGHPRRPRKYPGMGTIMATGPDDTEDLLKRAAEGDTQARRSSSTATASGCGR